MTDHAELIKKMVTDMCDIHNAYIEAKQTIQEEQGVMQDIAHKLELYRTTEVERQKLATIYANSARERRRCKEYIELMTPFIKYDNELDIAEYLTHVAKEMTDIKERQENRQYTPRSAKIKFDDAEKYDPNFYKRW